MPASRRQRSDPLYDQALDAATSLYPDSRTAVRVVRAATTDLEPLWHAGPQDTLVVESALDARLRAALSPHQGAPEPQVHQAVQALRVRLDVHSLFRHLLLTMEAATPAGATATSRDQFAGGWSLRVGLADLLAEADLDRFARAAGLATDNAAEPPVLFNTSLGPRHGVEPFLRVAAEHLAEEPVALARTLFTTAAPGPGLRRLAERMARRLDIDPDSPLGRTAALPALLRAYTEPIAAAERAAHGEEHPQVGRGRNVTVVYAQAGRMAADRLQSVVRALAEAPGSTTRSAPLTTDRASSRRRAVTISHGSAPRSFEALVTSAGWAAAAMVGGSCKVVRVQEGFAGMRLSKPLKGAYQARTGVVGLSSEVWQELHGLIDLRPGSDRTLDDRLAHCVRAAAQADAAWTLLHEYIHATDAFSTDNHRNMGRRGGPWRLPVGEAIAELTAEALLPEFLARSGLEAIDPLLREVRPRRSYRAQTRAFRPVAQQVADWMGLCLRDELVALKRAGGPEESMALLADHVLATLGLGADRTFCRQVARPMIRDVIQRGMVALQIRLDTGVGHAQLGDLFGRLNVELLRDVAVWLVRLHGTAPPTRSLRERGDRARGGARPRPATDRRPTPAAEID